MDQPRVHIVIPNLNGKHWLERCLPSLFASSTSDWECTIVDNGSTDQSVEYIRQHFPSIRIIANDHNMGFAPAMNLAMLDSKAPYIFALNNDTLLDDKCLEFLLEHLDQSEKEIVAAQALMVQMDSPNLIDDAGDHMSWYGQATKGHRNQLRSSIQDVVDIPFPSGGACLYRTQFLKDMEGYDADFFAYLEDVDLGVRGRLRGYRYQLHPDAVVYHKSHGSKITRSKYVRLLTRNRLLLFYRNFPWGVLVQKSPQILYGRVYHWMAYQRPLQSLMGYIDFILLWPRTLSLRVRRVRNSSISRKDSLHLLQDDKPVPSIRGLLMEYWRAFAKKLKS